MHQFRRYPSSLPRPTIKELYKSLFSSQPPIYHRAGRKPHASAFYTTATRSARPQLVPSRRIHDSINQSRLSRLLTTTPTYQNAASPKPKSHDRGPPSKETTQTDFGALDVLGGTPAPSTSIDACLWDGFHLNSGVKIVGGKGALLIAGEAFSWTPWKAGKKGGFVNEKGQFEVDDEAWGVLALVWPKPDLLIIGVGKQMRPLSPRTRQYINELGIRIEVQDTRNAAAQFNLLATERGVGSVAAALIPIGEGQ
ncbi:hypothetical protein F5884DRAFT_299868 [Xylogone sp. PMI_703]|nr:hypothetical protein F5884DRAFT_299868 [Xylogone sp. PMI_703]